MWKLDISSSSYKHFHWIWINVATISIWNVKGESLKKQLLSTQISNLFEARHPSRYTGCPRKNVPLGEGQTSSKGTFFLGHLVCSCDLCSFSFSINPTTLPHKGSLEWTSMRALLDHYVKGAKITIFGSIRSLFGKIWKIPDFLEPFPDTNLL